MAPWRSSCSFESVMTAVLHNMIDVEVSSTRGPALSSLCTCLYTQIFHKRQVYYQSLARLKMDLPGTFPQSSRVQPRSQEKCQPSLQLAQLTPASLPPWSSSSAPSRCCALSMGEVFESVPLSVSVPLPIHQSAAIPKCIPFKAFVGLQDHTCKTERSAGDSAGDASPNCHRPGRQVEPVMAVLPSCAMVSLRLPPSSCS